MSFYHNVFKLNLSFVLHVYSIAQVTLYLFSMLIAKVKRFRRTPTLNVFIVMTKRHRMTLQGCMMF